MYTNLNDFIRSSKRNVNEEASNSDDFKLEVKTSLKKLNEAFEELNALWHRDFNYNTDLNDYLVEDYPFKESFDELSLNVSNWIETSIKKLG